MYINVIDNNMVKSFSKWLVERQCKDSVFVEKIGMFTPIMNRTSPGGTPGGRGSPVAKKLRNIAIFTVKSLKKLLLGFGNVNEAFSDEAEKYEPTLFPTTCGYVCNFLSRGGVDIKQFQGKQQSSCGTEGCAYFYGDKVLKCTFGVDEWKVATALKGGNRELVPVIDTDQEPQTKTYLILSWKLNTSEAQARSEAIDKAGSCVAGWFSEDTVKATQANDQVALAALTSEKHFLASMEDGSSPGYWTWRTLDEGSKKIALYLFKVIVEIFKKSGYFISGDISANNMGFGGAAQDKPQMLDFGYPKVPGVGRVGPEKKQKNYGDDYGDYDY